MKLAPREYETMCWLANGLTVKEAATMMGLSEQTVKNYVSTAMRKLGVGNRFGAFLELGWLTPPEVKR